MQRNELVNDAPVAPAAGEPAMSREWEWQAHPGHDADHIVDKLVWRGMLLGVVEHFSDPAYACYGNLGQGFEVYDRTGPTFSLNDCRRKVEAMVLQHLIEGLS